jgi:vacuolar protein sorting-associated protein 45
MDLSTVVRFYIEKMLKEVKGMKAMLLDAETTNIVSTVYSQSEILEQEVYLVERLDADPGEQLLHLKVRDIFSPCSARLLLFRLIWAPSCLANRCLQLTRSFLVMYPCRLCAF